MYADLTPYIVVDMDEAQPRNGAQRSVLWHQFSVCLCSKLEWISMFQFYLASGFKMILQRITRPQGPFVAPLYRKFGKRPKRCVPFVLLCKVLAK